MSKYIGKKDRLTGWTSKALMDIGDGEARVLSQLIAKAGIEGFSKKSIMELLENYKELKKIDFSIPKNSIISYMRIEEIEKAQKEADSIIKGEVIKENA